MLNALSNSHAFTFCPEPTDDTRISAIIREILDFTEYGEIWNEIAPAEKYSAGQELTKHLREFSARGWSVFVERKTTTARTQGADGKEIILPNWTTSSLFLVSNKALSEEGKTMTPDSSPNSDSDSHPKSSHDVLKAVDRLRHREGNSNGGNT